MSRAAEVGVVRWPRRNVMMVVSAAVALIGLVAVIIVVSRPGPGTPVKPAADVPGQLFSPFTGELVPSLGPVLAVKIDNLAPARPQTGLTSADIVYVIPLIPFLRHCHHRLQARRFRLVVTDRSANSTVHL